MTPLPDTLVVLYSDPGDAVVRALVDNAQRLPLALVALPLDELLTVATGAQWSWRARSIDPVRTAVVNRLTSLDSLPSAFQRRQLWTWLGRELKRFRYVSSLPTASSITGCYGSLRDQWIDLPALIPDLVVPAHGTDARGPDVHGVDPWRLYSLGKKIAVQGHPDDRALLRYVRPEGMLVHLAQVGRMVFSAASLEEAGSRVRDTLVAFTNAIASVSATRILEHAFFVRPGDAVPVFYSTCPVAVITGRLEAYPRLVVEGLLDDIQRRSQRAAA